MSACAVNSLSLNPGERALARYYHTRRKGWIRFAQDIRSRRDPLLKRLADFPRCVLVAGCQRSGTTMLTRLLARSPGFTRFEFTHDDELDAALVLAGEISLPKTQRYCFQTTYLNERFPEYASIGPEQRLIWVLRNPFSVVYSMVHNWRRFALDEVYVSCARPEAARRHSLFRRFEADPIERACEAYRAKTAQILKIREIVPSQQLLIVDYDDIVKDAQRELPGIFEFIEERYTQDSAAGVRADSVGKAKRLSDRDRALIERIALPTYRQCSALAGRDVASVRASLAVGAHPAS